jgi:p-hydroxybenzoic acid efflux pump subunit AaeB
MASLPDVASAGRKWHWFLQDAFDDLRVRYGIKVGLAGMLALYVTQVLRLEHPNWAVLTVLAMMSSRYVGSIVLKALLRVVGTIGGALIGVWLVGDYASTPEIFLPVVFLVVTFSSYKFGQFPGSQVPYAYFLVGLTMISVATYGVADPAQVWYTGINRTLEILVGAISSLIVTSLVWPRYAREEFFENGRAALKTVSQLVSLETESYLRGTEAQLEQIHQAFGQQLSLLKNLLRAGSRESAVFRSRLSSYNAFLVSLTGLFHSALDLRLRRLEEMPILGQTQKELESLAVAIAQEFNILVGPHRRGEKLRSSRLNEAFGEFEAKVNEIRDQGVFHTVPLETGIAFLGHFSALRSVRDDLNDVRSLAAGLPRIGQASPDANPSWDFLPIIDWFWVKAGVKTGLASVVSILLLQWIHPPGPAAIPLSAWLFTNFGRLFLRTGGTGDLRAFQNAFRAAIFFAVCAVLLFIATPFLANYAIMNLVLFLILFGFGFVSARISGVSFWNLVAMLSISAFVGLNPQTPVPSQTIIDSFLGLTTGIIIATVIGRLIWPVLPQRLLRDDLLAMTTQLKALLSDDPHQERIRTQLAILPVEALQAAGQIQFAGCSQQERGRIAAFVRALQALAIQATELVSRRDILPEITKAILQPQFERLEIEFKQVLDAFAQCLRRGHCRRELPSIQGALAEMDEAVERVRQNRIFAGQMVEGPVRMFELVNRYHATAEALEKCGRLLLSLKIQRYWGDYAL